jgi:ABC-type nickel/cobalt efflux system permease component RcnA
MSFPGRSNEQYTHVIAGKAATMQAEYEEAEAALERALALAPGDAAVIAAISDLWQRKKNYSEKSKKMGQNMAKFLFGGELRKDTSDQEESDKPAQSEPADKSTEREQIAGVAATIPDEHDHSHEHAHVHSEQCLYTHHKDQKKIQNFLQPWMFFLAPVALFIVIACIMWFAGALGGERDRIADLL